MYTSTYERRLSCSHVQDAHFLRQLHVSHGHKAVHLAIEVKRGRERRDSQLIKIILRHIPTNKVHMACLYGRVGRVHRSAVARRMALSLAFATRIPSSSPLMFIVLGGGSSAVGRMMSLNRSGYPCEHISVMLGLRQVERVGETGRAPIRPCPVRLTSTVLVHARILLRGLPHRCVLRWRATRPRAPPMRSRVIPLR
jgi:hypothetical protein